MLLRPWTKKSGQRSRTDPATGILTEIAFYLTLVFAGIFVLSLALLSWWMHPATTAALPDEARRVLESELIGGGRHLGRWFALSLSIASITSGVVGLAFRLSHLGISRERMISGRERILGGGSAEESRSIAGVAVDQSVAASLPEPGSDSLENLPTTLPQWATCDVGMRLRHRLPSASDGRRRLLGVASLAIIWAATWFVLLAVVIAGQWGGNPRPILAMLLIPFALVSWWTNRFLWRSVRQLIGVGPTWVELQDHPIHPGEASELFVIQFGRLRLKKLKVELVCEEESVFRQGTDIRTDTHVAYREALTVQSSVRVDPASPWTQQLSFRMPPEAMHSFSAAHNAVRWRVVVSAQSRPWPSFCRSFPLLVHPVERHTTRTRR